MTIYDRSWYGRVLVERVEGFATAASGSAPIWRSTSSSSSSPSTGSCWSSSGSTSARTSSCAASRPARPRPRKQHKITDEDWRNREKWDDYEAAVDDMVARTSTDAPWVLVPGNDKKHARVQTLEAFCKRLERAL